MFTNLTSARAVATAIKDSFTAQKTSGSAWHTHTNTTKVQITTKLDEIRAL